MVQLKQPSALLKFINIKTKYYLDKFQIKFNKERSIYANLSPERKTENYVLEITTLLLIMFVKKKINVFFSQFIFYFY